MKSITRIFGVLQRAKRWRFVTIAVALLIASPDTARAQRALGVDVSQFQGAIDWSVVKAPTASGGGGKDFAFIRATRGGTWGSSTSSGMDTIGGGRYDDSAFITNITGAQAAGVLAGAYHLARIDLYDPSNPHGAITPEDEARHFLEIAGPYMGAGYLRPVLDLEGSNTATPAQLSDYATRFVNTIVAAKGPRASPIVYLNSSFANSEVDASLTTQPLWLAHPSASSDYQNGDPIPSPPGSNPYGVWDPSGTANPKPWAFWQYGTPASNHPDVNVPGITNAVDLDVAHGNANYLQSYLIPTVTWTGAGGNNSWNNNANWNVGKPLQADTIAFGNSANTNIRADFGVYDQNGPTADNQSPLHLQSATFLSGAPAYTIELYSAAVSSTSFYQASLVYDGAGVINSSGVMQNFVLDRGGVRGAANNEYIAVDGSKLTFNNSASAGSNVTYHAEGGVTTYVDGPVSAIFLRAPGSSIVFNNSASAGSATFIADGGGGNGGLFSRVEFHDTSTAASGTFTSNGGTLGGNPPGVYPVVICGFGGETIFFDHANAGTAHFTVNGTSAGGGSGGLTSFTQNSSADHGVFVSNPTTDTNHNGYAGAVQFTDSATAANGNFTNNPGPVSGSNGFTQFFDTTTAANAVIENVGGPSNWGGTTEFRDHATAANAVINNHGLSGGGNGGLPAITSFHDDSTAGASTIHNWPGPDTGGRTEFYDRSTAATANIILEPGNAGGTIVFNDNSSAGSAHLDAAAGGATGLILFNNQSTAGHAVIDLGVNGNNGLSLRFFDDASAGHATISVGSLSNLQFYNNATASTADITMRDNSTLIFNGNLAGQPTTTAASANIHLLGGALAGFFNWSTAANSQIVIEGASVAGENGGSMAFDSFADAGNATIFLNSSTIPGAPGGLLTFRNGASGPLARVATQAGSLIYVVGNASNGGTSLGSIEGAGDVSLGNSRLTVGGLDLNTTLGGTISGIDGSLTKIGTGTFTLTGTNTYSGLTTVAAGTLIVNGSIAGPSLVKGGGTLKGTGSMGTPTVEAGGVFAPGTSPGTITVAGLNLMSGSTLQYELGAGNIRDRIVVTNGGNVVLGGLLDLSILSGFNPPIGESISLFEGSIGSISGTFSAVNSPIFNGHALNLVYGANQIMLVVGDAGDFNHDGTVNAADYVVWLKGLGTTYTQEDYNVWRSHFGQTAGGGAGASANAAVSEPTTPVLLAFAAVGWCVRRSRAT